MTQHTHMEPKHRRPEMLQMTPTRPKSENLELMLKDFSLDDDEVMLSSPEVRHPRPLNLRSPTHPPPTILLSPQPQHERRNRSPYSRLHLRSHSSNGAAPPMTRAHSSPGSITSTPPARSSSPLRSPVRPRSRSPYRPSPSPGSEELSLQTSYSSPAGLSDIGSISEDSELELTPRAANQSPVYNVSQIHSSNTFPRQRRRPASPLHQVSISSPAFGTPPTSASSASSHSSPLPSPAKFNESFPTHESGTMRHFPSMHSLSSASSTSHSVPTTPTSVRSRSPSISSLETIPDSPDAEQAAEAETRAIARLKAAAEQQEEQEMQEQGRTRGGSLDVPRGQGGGGAGFGWPTMRDKRKRWSVCGAERRSDLDLETIWED